MPTLHIVRDRDQVRGDEEGARGVLAVAVMAELDTLAQARGYRCLEDVIRDYFRTREAA